MRKPYPSDMTDEPRAIDEPLVPVSKLGRPREVEMRSALNAIFYRARSGCQWDTPPHDFPPRSTVNDYFRLTERPHEAHDRRAKPGGACGLWPAGCR